MDIGEIGVQFLNASYVPSSAGAMSPVVQPGRDSGFEDLLKKVQNSQTVAKSESDKPVSPGPKKAVIDKTDKLYELCQELESFLIKNLIKSMRSTVQKTKLIDTGFAGEVYEDMLYDEYAKSYSKNANFGFAEMAYRELANY